MTPQKLSCTTTLKILTPSLHSSEVQSQFWKYSTTVSTLVGVLTDSKIKNPNRFNNKFIKCSH